MNNKDTQLMMEAYEGINKAIHVDDKNVTHQYSDEELHKMCIIALKDLINALYPGDVPKHLPKVDWLIDMLEKRSGIKQPTGV